jgi:hypothetical protein
MGHFHQMISSRTRQSAIAKSGHKLPKGAVYTSKRGINLPFWWFVEQEQDSGNAAGERSERSTCNLVDGYEIADQLNNVRNSQITG